MSETTIKNCAEIIHQYLIDNDYDGLVNPECECGCGLDELIPHEDCWIATCYPANKNTKYCFECGEIEEEEK